MTTNYKGFDLTYSLDKFGNVTIEEVEGSLTNQIALLTNALWNSYNDPNKLKQFTIELGYDIYDSFAHYGCDFAIDIDKWILTNPDMQQKVLIELLMEETAEIEEHLRELEY